MNEEIKITYCQHCGTATTSEICSICNNPTGITETISQNYPKTDCKTIDAKPLTIIKYIILIFWSIPLGVYLTDFILNQEFKDLRIYLILIVPLFIIGIVSIITLLYTIVQNTRLNIYGKEIEGIILENKSELNKITQKNSIYLKILIETTEGKKFIYYKIAEEKIQTTAYRLLKIMEIYPVDSKIKLKVYKDLYKIVK